MAHDTEEAWAAFARSAKAAAGRTPPLVLVLLLNRLCGCHDVTKRLKLARELCNQVDWESLDAELHAAGVDTGKRKRVEEEAVVQFPPDAGARAERMMRKGRQMVESMVALERSELWKASQEYYSSNGEMAWTSNDVPYGITSSMFAVSWYGKIVLEFCRFCKEDLKTESCFVLDLGSGHGCFAFRLALWLEERWQELAANGTSISKPCVVMTDFHDGVYKVHLERDGRFKDLVKRGFLDCATLDLTSITASTIKSIFFSGAGKSVNLEEYPIVLIGNYIIDSLPAGVYRMSRKKTTLKKRKDHTCHNTMRNENGRESPVLEACCVSCWSRRAPIRNKAIFNFIPNLESMVLKFQAMDIEEQNQERIVDAEVVKAILGDCEVGLVPTQGLESLFRVCSLPSQHKQPRLIVLGDKMCNSRQVPSRWENGIPGLDRHGNGGCVSCCVDPFIMEDILKQKAGREVMGFHEIKFGSGFSNSGFLILSENNFPTNSLTDLVDLLEKCTSTRSFGIVDFDGLRGWLVETETLCREVLSPLSEQDICALIKLSGYDLEFFLSIQWRLPSAMIGSRKVKDAALLCFHFRVPDWFHPKQIVYFCRWLYVNNFFSECAELCDTAKLLNVFTKESRDAKAIEKLLQKAHVKKRSL